MYRLDSVFLGFCRLGVGFVKSVGFVDGRAGRG